MIKDITKNDIDFILDTVLHRSEVAENLNNICSLLIERGEAHDRSKLDINGIEYEIFVSTRDRFKNADYGTEEYEELIKETKPAVDSHHEKNRHHVKHHADGINDMNLIDILEMLADWKASLRRGKSKRALSDTIEHAFKKHEIEPQLGKIIINTLQELGWYNVRE